MDTFPAEEGVIIQADARSIPLADESVNCVVTSPPYWGLRDYGVGGQIGLERTPEEYVATIVEVFREVRRVLKDDGTVWLNLGDSYCGYWGDKIEPCIKAGCPAGGVVLDPFAGSGTVGRVAVKWGRRAVLCDLSMEYLSKQATARTTNVQIETLLGGGTDGGG